MWGRHRSPARGIKPGHSLDAELCDGGCLDKEPGLVGWGLGVLLVVL